jgi:hypothetical protein
MSAPPDGLPVYRVLSGPDDAAFCHRVSDAIALGYSLYEGPAITFNGEQVIVAQALLWPLTGDEDGELLGRRDVQLLRALIGARAEVKASRGGVPLALLPLPGAVTDRPGRQHPEPDKGSGGGDGHRGSG